MGTAGQLATSITKAGPGIWTLSGTNTYSGATKVQAGTLIYALQRPGRRPSGHHHRGQAATGLFGTRQVSALTFDGGAARPNGTYGSSSSPATNKDDTRFTGPGTVTVGAITSPTTTTLALTSGANPSNGGVVADLHRHRRAAPRRPAAWCSMTD